MWRGILVSILAGACLLPVNGQAEDDGLVVRKTLSPELAVDLAEAALESCREADFQIAVAVVDRFGVLQVLLRDRYAGPHTPQAAARDITGALMLGGGVPVEAGG